MAFNIEQVEAFIAGGLQRKVRVVLKNGAAFTGILERYDELNELLYLDDDGTEHRIDIKTIVATSVKADD